MRESRTHTQYEREERKKKEEQIYSDLVAMNHSIIFKLVIGGSNVIELAQNLVSLLYT